MPATARLPILMTPAEKKHLVSRAKKAGLSTSEFMRRAADSYNVDQDIEALEAMIDQMNEATERTEKAIDDVLEFVAQSNQRIEAMRA